MKNIISKTNIKKPFFSPLITLVGSVLQLIAVRKGFPHDIVVGKTQTEESKLGKKAVNLVNSVSSIF